MSNKRTLSKKEKITLLQAVASGVVTDELEKLCFALTKQEHFEFQIVHSKEELKYYKEYEQYCKQHNLI